MHTYRTLRDPHRCVSDEQRANERPGAFPEDEDRRQARAALAAWDRAVAAYRALLLLPREWTSEAYEGACGEWLSSQRWQEKIAGPSSVASGA